MRYITTLSLIHDDDNILLAMKKRGFGAGLWNGYGGKVQPDEIIEDAMVRELSEESGLVAETYQKRGVMEFITKGSDDEFEVHVYEINDYSGELIETEEMSPKWFAKSGIPFDEMWPDDQHWLPMFLEGKSFTGKFLFDKDNNILDLDIREGL